MRALWPPINTHDGTSQTMDFNTVTITFRAIASSGGMLHCHQTAGN
jgi:hypothetical protein